MWKTVPLETYDTTIVAVRLRAKCIICGGKRDVSVERKCTTCGANEFTVIQEVQYAEELLGRK